MTDQLRPCPFCGCTPSNRHGEAYCESVWCPARGCSVATWNRRPLEDALRSEVARLTAERDAALAKVAEFRLVLEKMVDNEPCSLDHHGYCQTHQLNDPCEMAEARALLAQIEKGGA